MIEKTIIVVLFLVIGVFAYQYRVILKDYAVAVECGRTYQEQRDRALIDLAELTARHDFMRSERDALFAEKSNLYLPEGVKELMDLAGPIVQSMDTNTNSGEWKYHQAYALMLKQPEAQPWVQEKWKIGLAIHLALATQRVEQA